MTAVSLAVLGRTGEAFVHLEKVEPVAPALMRGFLAAVRADIEGRPADAIDLLRPALDAFDDPEARYYLARHLAYLGEREPVLTALEQMVERGYFCFPVFASDPWLDSLRDDARFATMQATARVRHEGALRSFLDNDGERILNLH